MLAFLNSRVITRLIAGTKKYVRGKNSLEMQTWKLFPFEGQRENCFEEIMQMLGANAKGLLLSTTSQRIRFRYSISLRVLPL